MNELQKAELDILIYFDDFAKKNNLKYFLFAGTLLGAIRHQGFIPWDDDIDVAMKRSEFDKFEKIFLKHNYKNDGYGYQSRRKYSFQAMPMSKIRSKALDIKERMPSTQKGNYGPWLDIFPFDNIPNDENLRKKQYKKVTFYNTIIKKFLLVQVEPEDKGLRKILKKIVQTLNETFYRVNFLLPIVFKLRDKHMQMYNNEETTHSADISFMHYKSYEDFSKRFFLNEDLADLVEAEFEGHTFSIPRNYDGILKTHYGNYMKLPPESERKIHKIEYVDSKKGGNNV